MEDQFSDIMSTSMKNSRNGYTPLCLNMKIFGNKQNCFNTNGEFGLVFHARITLSVWDSRRDECYMGTANLTWIELEGNLGVGIIFRDENVTKISNSITLLMSSSSMDEVNYGEEKFSRS